MTSLTPNLSKPTPSAEIEMIANVRQSSESALKALKMFHHSLVAARLPDSISSYRNMCDTLLGQRIWMMDKNDLEAQKNFAELSKVATAIVDIFEPYNAAFNKLTAMDNETNTSIDNPDETSATELNNTLAKQPITDKKIKAASHYDLVLDFLTNQKKRVSITKLRSETGLRRNDLESILDKLIDSGMVVNKRVNGRELFEKL